MSAVDLQEKCTMEGEGGGDVRVTVEKEGKLKKSYFDVLGVCCSTEVVIIDKVLQNLNGVQSVRVIVPTRTLIVVHDELLVSQSQIVKVLNLARMEANLRTRQGPQFTKKWPTPYTMACGLLLLVSLGHYAYRPLRWVAVASVAVGIYPILRKSFVSIKNLILDINILAIMAVLGTMLLKDYVEAATIVFLFTIAEWLESRASQQATVVMSELLNMEPEKAVIAETGEIVNAADVKLGTVLAVKAGEVVPIDGIVVEGEAEVDEKMLTGESFPVVKQKDSTVLAGTMNLDGYIAVKTTAVAEDCVVSKMAKLVEEAQTSKSKTQRFIDKCAKYYTPAVLVVSICLAVIPAALSHHNRDRWFYLALVVLVSACPCGLILSTPVATFCALSKAAKSGVLLKGGDHLETLAKVKTAAFDKTGTITTGEFVVTDFKTVSPDLSLRTLLYWVASLESKSSHPMAKALMDYAQLHSIEPRPEAVVEFHNYPGEGICGKLDGQDIYIGNKKIALRAQCITEIEVSASEGKTRGYIYAGGVLTGWFSLSDAVRSGAAQAVNELKSMKILTMMLTGDSHAAAAQAQNQLKNSIEVVHAELLPEDKARIIKECEGPVAMIGDGVNDAPALATADVGISMGLAGSALATETGNIILMSNDIRKVPKAIKLARRAYSKVIQNVVLSLAIKGLILALAISGRPLVWAAVLADVGTCLLVIFNSMLLLGGIGRKSRGPPKCLKDPEQMFKLPDVDIESQTSDKDVEMGSKTCRSRCCAKNLDVQTVENDTAIGWSSAGENAGGSRACRRRCCSKKNDDAGLADIDHSSGIRDTPAGSKSCAKGCCSKNKENSDAALDADTGFIAAESAKIDTLASLEKSETRAASKSCAKGCCSGKKEKFTTSPVADIILITAESAISDARESSEKIGTPVDRMRCTKGCCGSDKSDKSVVKVSSTEICLGVADSGRSLEVKEAPSGCANGCCFEKKEKSLGGSVADTGLVTAESVKSDTRANLEEIETLATSKSCAKGCCSGKKEKSCAGSATDIGSVTAESAKGDAGACLEKNETLAASKSCARGCCSGNKEKSSAGSVADIGSVTVESPKNGTRASSEKSETAGYSKGCATGCCSRKKEKSSAGSVSDIGLINAESIKNDTWASMEKSETLAASMSCAKGCCSGKKEKPSAGSVADTGLITSESAKNDSLWSLGKSATLATSRSCTKGCCSGKKENSTAGSLAETGLITAESPKNQFAGEFGKIGESCC
uniref:HMA domain-containing protein n=2 Tax=Kalanchoe fedtschenkoi TaxID=63787 RepID=A0A7N0T4N3_KALFE